MDKPWLSQYPAGVPAEVKTDLYPSLVQLVDHALAKRADKRAADLQPLSTTLLDREGSNLDRDVVAVHDALLAFETVDARAAKVVELRYFGGLELEEIGEALGVSLATIKRDWAVARAWLRRELGGS